MTDEDKFKQMTETLRRFYPDQQVALYLQWIIKSDRAKEYWLTADNALLSEAAKKYWEKREEMIWNHKRD